MCRLFAMIARSNVDTGYLVKDAPRSLLYQSRVDRRHLQADGWGLGWFEGGRPKILKSPKPIYRDQALLQKAVKRAKGKTLLGHVRWASNPLKLPRHRLIGLEHSQPFAFRRWLFAHNGTLLIPKEVRAHLGVLDKYIQGNNDSEVLFYWLMKYLRKPLARGQARGIVASIGRSLAGLDDLWKDCRRKYPLYKHPYHGLNWVLTDGKILVSMCYVNPGGFGKAKSLCDRRRPYYQLQLSAAPEEVCVASEPLDSTRSWRPMRHGEIVIAHRKKDSMKAEILTIGLPQ